MARILTALAGATVITVSIFLVMAQVAKSFGKRDPTRYFSVDFISGSDERRKPQLPRLPKLPPERARLEYERRLNRLAVELPAVDDAPIPSESVLAPDLSDEQPEG